MSDYFEIDFLDVNAKESGDAIPLRYKIGTETRIHVTDGGFQKTGDKIVEHINEYYDEPDTIDAVIVSHPDGDHAGGLRTVLENFEVSELLKKRLKEIYPNVATLEEIAEEEDIPIYEPFQGEKIGDFTVLAPTKERYLDLIVESEKTPQATRESIQAFLAKADSSQAAWGEESFSSEETSAENNMSVIQYANLCSEKILLTADAGRDALTEAADYAPWAGLILPGINRFQVPHHGSRRNLSIEILNRWLGEVLPESHVLKPEKGLDRSLLS